jgi:uncharacterized protein (TIGR02466 family)
MKTCIFTTYNYQDDDNLIRQQEKRIQEIIANTDIRFIPLRYNLPKKYVSVEQAIEYGLSYLTNDFDVVIYLTVGYVPVSLEKLNDIINKTQHNFRFKDGESFSTTKESKQEFIEEKFTERVRIVENILQPELFNPFGTFLLKHKIPLSIFDALVKETDSVREKLKDGEYVKENNFTDYLAGRNSYQIKMSREYMRENDIDSYILSLGEHYCNSVGSPFTKIKMGSTWINYGYKGDFNPIHTHDALLSGCFYIHQDEGIMMEQEYDFGGRAASGIPGMTHFVHDLNSHPFNRFSYSNKFVSGDMIMFPSWLTHWVNPFQTDGERVTIAFNILEDK